MVSDSDHANRSLSLLLAGQSGQRETVAAPVQILLQPPATQPSPEWPHSCPGGPQLDSDAVPEV